MGEIERFTGLDPIADQFPHVSVYNYAENGVPGETDLRSLQSMSMSIKVFGIVDLSLS
jgi:hypothetical protein